jgi:hypothetical protein
VIHAAADCVLNISACLKTQRGSFLGEGRQSIKYYLKSFIITFENLFYP